MSNSQEAWRRALLSQQLQGHRYLRFSPPLEAVYDEYRRQRLTNRNRRLLYAIAGPLFIGALIGLDFLSLPNEVALEILPLRLLGVLFMLLAAVYCHLRRDRPDSVELGYLLGYLTYGLTLVAIARVGAQHGVGFFVDGLLLLLMLAYMGWQLSFRQIIRASWALSILYVVFGLMPAGLDDSGFEFRITSLLCITIIGFFSVYRRDHGRRTTWLRFELLDIARKREEEDARRMRLLAAAGHDLRQPLNAMGLYAQHLQERAADDEVRDISQRLSASVKQLGHLLQSLLDYTSLSLPGVVQAQPQPVALQPLLQRLAAESEPLARKQGVMLSLIANDDLWTHSDPLLLERIVRNLLTNALRHAGAAQVWLRLEAQGERLRLEIGDDGRGFTVEQQRQAFDEFQQFAPSQPSVERGLGLGLAIVRQLAELLGHQLTLTSEPGKGAQFKLILQPCAALVTQAPVAVPAAARLEGRVLLVEDDAASREALSGLLTRWGCEVCACASLAEALERLPQVQPQLLISDYRLDGPENGLQVIELLRERAVEMLPAVLITADVGTNLADRCALAHVTLFGKPILPVRLLQTLAVLLGQRQVRAC
ncbi:hybrid sensor histidine kinase/response regulator [Pseudomonas sp. LS44]|uniref:hybrid sensor histidine kinase/response regulator n=1 Tax=Pseudomonas sp. LS44 TaxID=1357074 RepID=UPI00215ACF80|nr:hybrid sensor histidine kinase/response regulator [Pseudomonas sp. LS44]UVE18741.1 hybrid sensor histidine kinase/response regulator [Pseudomonas sp. LS44]